MVLMPLRTTTPPPLSSHPLINQPLSSHLDISTPMKPQLHPLINPCPLSSLPLDISSHRKPQLHTLIDQFPLSSLPQTNLLPQSSLPLVINSLLKPLNHRTPPFQMTKSKLVDESRERRGTHFKRVPSYPSSYASS